MRQNVVGVDVEVAGGLPVVQLELVVVSEDLALEAVPWADLDLAVDLPHASRESPRRIERVWNRRSLSERRWVPWRLCLVITVGACLPSPLTWAILRWFSTSEGLFQIQILGGSACVCECECNIFYFVVSLAFKWHSCIQLGGVRYT